MIKENDIQWLSEQIANFIYKAPHYPVPQEGAPRNSEFQELMRKGFFDCYKLLLCARPEVFDEVMNHLPPTTDREGVEA